MIYDGAMSQQTHCNLTAYLAQELRKGGIYVVFSWEKVIDCLVWQLSALVQHEERPLHCILLLEKRPQIQGWYLLYVFIKLGTICIEKDRQKATAHRLSWSLTTERSPEVSKVRRVSSLWAQRLWSPPVPTSCMQHSSLRTSQCPSHTVNPVSHWRLHQDRSSQLQMLFKSNTGKSRDFSIW